MNKYLARIVRIPFTRSSQFYFILFIAISSIIITLNLYPSASDDAYITYRYSYNFATGAGLVYNPSEPQLSTSAPLYALILGILAIACPDRIPVIAGCINGLGLFAGTLALYYFGHRRRQDLVGVFCSLAYLFLPMVLEMFGSEVIPLISLILWAFIAYEERVLVLSGSLMGLAVGFQMGAFIPFIFLSVCYLIIELKLPSKLILSFIVACGIWTIILILSNGNLIPIMPLQDISEMQRSNWLRFSQNTYSQIGERYDCIQTPSSNSFPISQRYLLLYPIGIISVILTSQYWFLILFSQVLIIFGYIVIGYPLNNTFFTPFLLIAAILIGTGLSILPISLLSFIRKLDKNLKIESYLLIAVLCLGLILPLIVETTLGVINSRLAIQDTYPSNHYKKIGIWLDNNIPVDVTVGYHEFGYIGFYSERSMIEPIGKVTPSAIGQVMKRDLAWVYREYLPDYLVVNDRFTGILGPYQQEPWFKNCYQEVHSVESIKIYQRCDEVEGEDLVVLEKVQPLNDQPAGEILPYRTVGQTFIAKQDRLRAVSVLLATYGREVEGPLVFHLQEVSEEFRGPDLATIEVNISEIEDNMWRVFSFPEITDSADRLYYFYLESPQAVSGEAITGWSTTGDSYPGGTLFIDHLPQSGDLSFNLYYVRP